MRNDQRDRDQFRKLRISVSKGFLVISIKDADEKIALDEIEALVKLVNSNIPARGKVNILTFTDKQFGKIVILENNKRVRSKENPDQLVIFGDPES